MSPSSRRIVRIPSTALAVAKCGIAAPSRTRRVTPSTGVANATKAILTFAKNRLTWRGFCGAPSFNDNGGLGPRVNDKEMPARY